MAIVGGGWYFEVMRRNLVSIILISFGAASAVLMFTIFLPNIYRSSAVIKPVSQESQKYFSPLEQLASIGVPIPTNTRIEDLEVLLKSEDLTTRVFRKYDLWKEVFKEEIDRSTGKRKEGILSSFRASVKGDEASGDWDVIRVAKKALSVRTDTRRGIVTISFESRHPALSAKIVGHYLDEAKSRLQEEELERARRNKEFLQDQITKTVDVLTRDRLYSLYGKEIEMEMLALNREQFGFRLVDSPKPPDRKVSPQRALATIIAGLTAFFISVVCFAAIDAGKKRKK